MQPAPKKRRTSRGESAGGALGEEEEVVLQMEETLCLLDALPEALVVYNVLSHLEPEDLCQLIAVSRRMRTLQEVHDSHLWGKIVENRWSTGLVPEACALAGSYKAFALQKQLSCTQLGFPAGWHGPCEFELRASLRRLATTIGAAPSSSVIFLLDGSGSVGDEEFAASTSFIARAANEVRVQAETCCKVSVLQFSNDVRTEWEDRPDAPPLPGFEATIRAMVRINGGTNIAAALTHAGKLLKKTGAEEDMAKAIVLITDGRLDGYQAKEARQVAAALADEHPNTTLFAFGVGRGIDRGELLSIIQAAPPSRCQYRDPSARYLDLFYREDAYW